MLIEIDEDEFLDETGEEYEASSFGGFGDYMRRKKIKLQNLDAEIRASSRDCPPIFRGVVAHVNGYTQPSLQDLHRLIVSHGGGFLQYLDNKTSATHIIASSLTPKKREEFRRYRIVKPAWVTESIKAGRLLPWNEFRAVDEGQTQKVLKFGGGRITSESNTLQSGYRDQSRVSWYNSQLQNTNSNGSSRHVQGKSPPTPQLPISTSSPRSMTPVGDSISTTHLGGKSAERPAMSTNSHQQSNDQETSIKTPSKQRTIPYAEDPDELESPHKDGSARIQVDPVLSNSAHKPLNLSGSQFILPTPPEPKAAPAPVSDIRSKLAAQARPRKSSASGRPSPSSHETNLSLAQPKEPAGAEPPPQSEIDPETLAALPEDIRKEVLGYYRQKPASPNLPASSPVPFSTISTPVPAPTECKRNLSPPQRGPSHPATNTNSENALSKFGFVSQCAPSSIPGKEDNLPGSNFPTPEARGSQPTEEATPTKNEPSPEEGPVFTSQRLSNVEDLRNAISAWYSTFTADGPYDDDVEALCIYLRRVIAEEKDVDKALSVVRWLMWLVGQHEQPEPRVTPEDDVVSWADAIKTMQQSVQDALKATGLATVEFT